MSQELSGIPVSEILRGWTVTRGIPADMIGGINSGIYQLNGGVIRIAAGHDRAGQIVRHLIPIDTEVVPTMDVLQVATRTMQLSGLNLAVSAVGFGVLHAKLTALDENLKTLKHSVDGIARLLELEERAKIKAALKFLSMVMKDGSMGTRENHLLNGILAVFGPVNAKYRELLPGSTSETAMACQEYFALTSLAIATCSAELGMVGAARRNLKDDFTFWAEQARRIAEKDLLGEHPERFVYSEFVAEVSLREVATWLNFVQNENRSEAERIDELRKKIHLSPVEEGSWIPWSAKEKSEPIIEVDKAERIPALRKLVARNNVFRGYVDQYALLDENGITPSEFQRKMNALDPVNMVDGYVILQPAQAEVS